MVVVTSADSAQEKGERFAGAAPIRAGAVRGRAPLWILALGDGQTVILHLAAKEEESFRCWLCSLWAAKENAIPARPLSL